MLCKDISHKICVQQTEKISADLKKFKEKRVPEIESTFEKIEKQFQSQKTDFQVQVKRIDKNIELAIENLE